jgi:hypothetical protein
MTRSISCVMNFQGISSSAANALAWTSSWSEVPSRQLTRSPLRSLSSERAVFEVGEERGWRADRPLRGLRGSGEVRSLVSVFAPTLLSMLDIHRAISNIGLPSDNCPSMGPGAALTARGLARKGSRPSMQHKRIPLRRNEALWFAGAEKPRFSVSQAWPICLGCSHIHTRCVGRWQCHQRRRGSGQASLLNVSM